MTKGVVCGVWLPTVRRREHPLPEAITHIPAPHAPPPPHLHPSIPPSLPYKDKTHRRQCKMSSSKNLPYKRDFAAGVYLCLKSRAPYLPPTCIHYTVYLFTQGRERWGGGRVEPQRRFNSSQSWVENTNMTDCIYTLQSINSEKHLKQSPFTGQFFR
jgi:hypothetical protein